MVLIVHSKSMVRNQIQALLGSLKLGLSFHHADHGHKAMEVIGEHGKKIRLVIGSVDAVGASKVNLSEYVKGKHPDALVVLFGKESPPADHGAHLYLNTPLNTKDFGEIIKWLMGKA